MEVVVVIVDSPRNLVNILRLEFLGLAQGKGGQQYQQEQEVAVTQVFPFCILLRECDVLRNERTGSLRHAINPH